jgi:hypothetical protein
MIPRRIFTPDELFELAIAGTPAREHDLVHWVDPQGREHTAVVVAYWRIVQHDIEAARQLRTDTLIP